MARKKLEFHATTPLPDLEEDQAASSRDIWLATWGVVAVFVIVVLVLFFTGQLGTMTGAGVTLIPEQAACDEGENAFTDISYVNDAKARGAICKRGKLHYVVCCRWP